MTINLFSDTATKPTPEMLQAMVQAPLGDEQRRDDPTVNKLESQAAALLGKEAALLVPSATMANQIAMVLHCPYASEIICHESSHIFNFEAAGAALHARAQLRSLAGSGYFFDGASVEALIQSKDPHHAVTRGVLIENTSNLGGGTIWPDADFNSVIDVCRRHGLVVHLDGARLFNAAIKRGVALTHWTSHVDSVQVCFSKGLGCPFGAVLAGSATLIERARRIKQGFGGALRQAGVIAGAMLYALEHHVERLADDHRQLAELAAGIVDVPGIELSPYETNILYFHHKQIPAAVLAEQLNQNGLDVSVLGSRLRACTYLGITDAQIREAATIIRETVRRIAS